MNGLRSKQERTHALISGTDRDHPTRQLLLRCSNFRHPWRSPTGHPSLNKGGEGAAISPPYFQGRSCASQRFAALAQPEQRRVDAQRTGWLGGCALRLRRFLTFILLPLFLLTACGFHLRGVVQLPRGMDVTYLQDQQPSSSIATPLRQMLTSNGARVTDNPDEATATLHILSETFDRRMISIGRTVSEKNYELVYTVSFSAQAKNNAWSSDAQEIRITREMIFDEAQVLAKTAEQDQLRNVMVQDAARQILVRLQAKAK